MNYRLQRGFTLIELLVVIAIIGILAAVVLASLNDARNSGADSAIKQMLGNARSQAELIYNQNSYNYTNVCQNVATNPITKMLTAVDNNNASVSSVDYTLTNASSAATVNCHSSTVGYAIISPLNVTTGGAAWCVDSTGYSGTVTAATALGSSDVTCL